MEMFSGIDIFIQPLRENRINLKNEENDITPILLKYFTNRKLNINV